MFTKMSKAKSWLLFGVSIVVACLSVFLAYAVSSQTVGTIIMVIAFLFSSFMLQVALSKTIRVKEKKVNYISNEYEVEDFNRLEESLRKEKFNSHKTSFGTAFIKIENKVAYKVILITNVENYLNQTEQDKSGKTTKGIDDCTSFVGFEIFREIDDTISSKIKDFSFQGDKVFYEGFYYIEEENLLIEPNAIVPLEHHDMNVKHLKNILGLKLKDDIEN